MENSMRVDAQRSNKSMSSGSLSFSHHLRKGMIAHNIILDFTVLFAMCV